MIHLLAGKEREAHDEIRRVPNCDCWIRTHQVRDVRAKATRELETAQAELALAEARLTRAQTMVADRSGSQRSLDEAQAQRQVAAAAVSAAQSLVRTIAGGSLDSDIALSVRSPVDGVVRAVRVTVGQSVPQGASLVEIAGTGRWVRASFAGSDAQAMTTLREVHARRDSKC